MWPPEFLWKQLVLAVHLHCPMLLALATCRSKVTGRAALLGRPVASAHGAPPPTPRRGGSPKIADIAKRLPFHQRASVTIVAAGARTTAGRAHDPTFHSQLHFEGHVLTKFTGALRARGRGGRPPGRGCPTPTLSDSHVPLPVPWTQRFPSEART